MARGSHDLLGRSALGHERACAGVECVEELVVPGVHREHDDAHVRRLGAQGADDLEAVAVRKAQVDDGDRGLALAAHRDALGDARRLGHHLDVRLALQCTAQALADELVVVDEEDGDRHLPSSSARPAACRDNSTTVPWGLRRLTVRLAPIRVARSRMMVRPKLSGRARPSAMP